MGLISQLDRMHAYFKRASLGSKLEGLIELTTELKTKVDALAALTAQTKTVVNAGTGTVTAATVTATTKPAVAELEA